MYLKLIGLALLLSVTACGGGGDNDGSRFKKNNNTKEVSQNVALASNGASIQSATYDSNAAKYAIDGDTTTSNYWAGNTANENFVIGFQDSAELTKVDVYTNISTGDQTSPPITIEISTNQRTWRTLVGTANNGGIQCSNSGFSGNKFLCFIANENARYIRIGTNSGNVNIYEVEVTGTVTVPLN
ncbi:discoidin domain-containing protein [Pseudomonas sp. HK3]